MTEEQKQALIEHAKSWIADAEAARDELPFGLDGDTEKELSLIKIALAALTAAPVKLPDGFAPSVTRYGSQSTSYRAIMTGNGDWIHKDQAIEAIRAAGYEVQE